MIFTDYYRFEKLPGTKSKTRIDCTASTKSYNTFEAMRNKQGDLFLYLGDNTYTNAGQKRKADLALSKVKHISSVFNPDREQPYWYGDMNHTADSLLFIHRGFSLVNGAIQIGAEIEIFVARGQRDNRNGLYNSLVDGDFNDEIEALKQKAVTELVTK